MCENCVDSSKPYRPTPSSEVPAPSSEIPVLVEEPRLPDSRKPGW